jgi:hypothetical protein
MLRGSVRSEEPRTVNGAAGELVNVNWKLPLESTVGSRRVGRVVLRFAELEANKVSEA